MEQSFIIYLDKYNSLVIHYYYNNVTNLNVIYLMCGKELMYISAETRLFKVKEKFMQIVNNDLRLMFFLKKMQKCLQRIEI